MNGVNWLSNPRVLTMIHIKTIIVPWGFIVVSSVPLVGLSIAGVFTVLLCTWDKSDTSYSPLHFFISPLLHQEDQLRTASHPFQRWPAGGKAKQDTWIQDSHTTNEESSQLGTAAACSSYWSPCWLEKKCTRGIADGWMAEGTQSLKGTLGGYFIDDITTIKQWEYSHVWKRLWKKPYYGKGTQSWPERWPAVIEVKGWMSLGKKQPP